MQNILVMQCHIGVVHSEIIIVGYTLQRSHWRRNLIGWLGTRGVASGRRAEVGRLEGGYSRRHEGVGWGDDRGRTTGVALKN